MSVHGNLLFMSVEQTRGRLDCGTQGVEAPVSADRFPRRADLRHQRYPEAEAGRRHPDVPRLAHAHARDRSEGSRERVRLRIGNQHGAIGRGARGLFRPRTERRPEHGAVQHRRDSGAARRAGQGEDRQPAAHLRRSRRRARSPACGRAATTDPAPRRRTSPISATTSPCSRRLASPPVRARATASCSTSPIRCTPCGSTRSSTRTSRTGIRRRSTTTARR